MARAGAAGCIIWRTSLCRASAPFHDPARCLLWACFALSLLAGYGLDRVRTRPLGLIAAVLLLAFADLTYFGRTLYPLADSARCSRSRRHRRRPVGPRTCEHTRARILAPTAGVWLRFTGLKSFRQDVPGYQTLWADTLTPNLMMPYGLRDAYGYEPVALKTRRRRTATRQRRSTRRPSRKYGRRREPRGRARREVHRRLRVTPPETTLPGLVPVRAALTLAPPGRQSGPGASVYLSRNAQWQPRAHLEGSSVPIGIQEDGPDRVTLTCLTTGPARLVLADTRQRAGRRRTTGGRCPSKPIGAASAQ